MTESAGNAGQASAFSCVRRTSGSVSVVIPTIGRPSLAAAVDSVLAQAESVGEIIIVADTADPLALPSDLLPSDVLQSDVKVRVIRTGPGAGGNVARQAGIAHARGEIIALLDDDDTWFPDKISTQLERANTIPPAVREWVVGCSVVAVTPDGRQRVWPSKVIAPSQDLAEYIFVRHGLRRGHGFLQASGLMFPRHLGLEVPFRPQLRFHQDITWLLDVTQRYPGIPVAQVARPLVRYHVGAGSVSTAIRSGQSIDWAREHLAGRSARARGDFLMTVPVHYARRERSVRRAISAIAAGFSLGRPSWRASAYAGASLGLISLDLSLGWFRRLRRAPN